LRLFFGSVWQKDAAGRFVVLLYVLDNDVIEQWLQIHGDLHSLVIRLRQGFSTLGARALAVPY
jgi:hypothetical protein